jgi:arylsulfatase A-like enzyme
MKRRTFLRTAGLLGGGAIAGSVLGERALFGGHPLSADRPNIIFIMSDDHAAHAISAYGSRVNTTPNIDRLAREGMTFRNVFATNAVCTPSRASILTGQYSHMNGVPVFNRFDSRRLTVAKLLQEGGYHTGMIGKWHLGSDPQGFDCWEILPGQGEYFDPVLYNATGEKKYEGRYVTDVITELGVDFITGRPSDKPFFLMLHHKAPHRPWEPDEKHRAMFAGRAIPEPATLRDDYSTRTDAIHENRQRVFSDLQRRDLKLEPPAGLTGADRERWLSTKPDTAMIHNGAAVDTITGERLNSWKYQRYMQDYLAVIQGVDDSVGVILDLLDREGLARNTMIVYTSDQGFYLGDHGMYDKRFMYEEALRMPFLVRWPHMIEPGSESEEIGLNIDFAETFLDAAGLSSPPDMQGRSLVPLMRGKVPADWRGSMYYRYYHDPGDHNTRAHYGLRTRTHKLIYFWRKDQWELYDLRADPGELRNLYGRPGQEEITASLKAELKRLRAQVQDDDRYATQLPPGSVDGTAAMLRGR